MSGNNGTVYALVVFVVLSVALLVATAFAYSRQGELTTANDKLTAEKATAESAVKKQLQAINRLKQVLGYDYPELGVEDETNPQTVIGALKNDLSSVDGFLSDAKLPALGDASVSAALRNLQATLNNTRLQSSSRQTNLVQEQSNLMALNQLKQKVIDQHLSQVQKVEEDLQKKEKSHTEEMDRKNAQIDSLFVEKKELQDTLTSLEQEHKETVEQLEEYITRLETANSRLSERLAELEDLSFERADGLISHVDHNRNLVWINLGEKDGLRVRTTFSVYAKANHGVGRRNKEDIKARIEVTSVTGAHLAEARILDQDIYRPIAKNDPVYSPAFTAGSTEYFSIVGLVDLDNDGVSDRGYLENMVRAAGADFDNVVDDDGNQSGSGITAKTTFLVQGEIPEAVTSGDARKDEAYKRMREAHLKLRQDARAQGVRMITLGDFKDYLGINPPPRSWRPGDSRPYTLKAGTRRPGIEDAIGRSRESSGQVSGSYGRSKRLGQKSSSGQTSGLFGK